MAGNNLTLTGAIFDSTTQKFGSAALSGGYGQGATGVSGATGVGFTWECWVKKSGAPAVANAIRAVLFGVNNRWVH